MNTTNFDHTMCESIDHLILSCHYNVQDRANDLRRQAARHLHQAQQCRLAAQGVSPAITVVFEHRAAEEEAKAGKLLDMPVVKDNPPCANPPRTSRAVRDQKLVDRQAVRDKKLVDRQAVRAALDQKLVDRQAVRAALDQKLVDRQAVRAALDQKLVDRQAVRAALDQKLVDRQAVRAALDQKLVDRQAVRDKKLVDRQAVKAQKLVDRQAVRAALDQKLVDRQAVRDKKLVDRQAVKAQKLVDRWVQNNPSDTTDGRKYKITPETIDNFRLFRGLSRVERLVGGL